MFELFERVSCGLQVLSGSAALREGINMAPKRELSQPLPPGVVKQGVPLPPPRKKATTSTAASSASQNWNPEEVADERKDKTWWTKGTKGRKKKMRAVEHWLKKNQENFVKMDECDFVKRSLPPQESPSAYFRKTARKFELIRYFVFLFQMLLLFIRIWRPTKAQVKHYGLGVQTEARRALVIIHSGELPPESVAQLKSLKRHLFGRLARETENLSTINSIAQKESDSDTVMSTTYRIMDHVDEVMIPAVMKGTFPKLNPAFDALTQYAGCWEDRCCKERNVQVIRGLTWVGCLSWLGCFYKLKLFRISFSRHSYLFLVLAGMAGDDGRCSMGRHEEEKIHEHGLADLC